MFGCRIGQSRLTNQIRQLLRVLQHQDQHAVDLERMMGVVWDGLGVVVVTNLLVIGSDAMIIMETRRVLVILILIIFADIGS